MCPWRLRLKLRLPRTPRLYLSWRTCGLRQSGKQHQHLSMTTMRLGKRGKHVKGKKGKDRGKGKHKGKHEGSPKFEG